VLLGLRSKEKGMHDLALEEFRKKRLDQKSQIFFLKSIIKVNFNLPLS
jgi:hypothetical protein